jgi:hypothetical protein
VKWKSSKGIEKIREISEASKRSAKQGRKRRSGVGRKETPKKRRLNKRKTATSRR